MNVGVAGGVKERKEEKWDEKCVSTNSDKARSENKKQQKRGARFFWPGGDYVSLGWPLLCVCVPVYVSPEPRYLPY